MARKSDQNIMKSRASQITDPITTNVVYDLQVFADGTWKLYPYIEGQASYGDFIETLDGIQNRRIRAQVELEIKRHLENLRAQKAT